MSVPDYHSKYRDFPYHNKSLKIGMVGMTEGNGHPYSWSAIFNGYNPEEMKYNPFPSIYFYLEQQPESTFGIPGAKVTHVFCDKKNDAENIQRCSLVDHVVRQPEDMIGSVDAVIIATDIGSEHVDRCKPFIEAGVPLFIDKPLVDHMNDLNTFYKWKKAEGRFISSSSMRYSKEIEPYYQSAYELGNLRYIGAYSPQKWETYGIHCLEAIYPILGPGFLSIQNTGTKERNFIHLIHQSGCDVNIVVSNDMYSAFGNIVLMGTSSAVTIHMKDHFYAFKKQLQLFVHYLRTGVEPIPFNETIELMKLVIGGIQSRDEGGRRIMLDEMNI
ncbi:Gfo/Idh/MocA family oxidoreductase [Lederbergia sp. NSJ-179]|uniref:Gfo/Idh/MocA family oxidoreductase n=1 Tax=Lederbergia sp. NSJ-179 TaxID=2931402 RepID=UPI001FD38A58|nr:Gfo/Idh/MocA family oxidoreductase [Lederbergia sp. NSJ-179]MCJ7841354.1 Gfo/Idh/MocA family oxidoreductase [Lederbergia sp. NSJ-179]